MPTNRNIFGRSHARAYAGACESVMHSVNSASSDFAYEHDFSMNDNSSAQSHASAEDREHYFEMRYMTALERREYANHVLLRGDEGFRLNEGALREGERWNDRLTAGAGDCSQNGGEVADGTEVDLLELADRQDALIEKFVQRIMPKKAKPTRRGKREDLMGNQVDHALSGQLVDDETAARWNSTMVEGSWADEPEDFDSTSDSSTRRGRFIVDTSDCMNTDIVISGRGKTGKAKKKKAGMTVLAPREMVLRGPCLFEAVHRRFLSAKEFFPRIDIMSYKFFNIETGASDVLIREVPAQYYRRKLVLSLKVRRSHHLARRGFASRSPLRPREMQSVASTVLSAGFRRVYGDTEWKTNPNMIAQQCGLLHMTHSFWAGLRGRYYVDGEVIVIDRLRNLFVSYDVISSAFTRDGVECDLVLDLESFLYAHYLLIVLGKLNTGSASRMYDRSGNRDISGRIYRLMQDMLRRMINWSIFKLRKDTGFVHAGLAICKRFETEWVSTVNEYAHDLAIKNGNPELDEDIANMLSKPGHPISVDRWERGDHSFDVSSPVDLSCGIAQLTEIAKTAHRNYADDSFSDRFTRILFNGRLTFVQSSGFLGRPILSDIPIHETFEDFCAFFVQEQSIYESKKDALVQENVVSIKSNVFDLLG